MKKLYQFPVPGENWAPRWWVLTLILLGVMIQDFWAAALPRWLMESFWVLLFCFLVGAYAWYVINAYWTRCRLQQTAYAVTSQRAIIIAKARMVTIASFAPRDLSPIESVEYAEDWGDVLFGKRQVRHWFLPHPTRSGFRGILGMQQVMQLLLDLEAREQTDLELKDDQHDGSD